MPLAAVAPLYKEADSEWLVITIVRTDWELPRWKLSLDAGHQAWENTLQGDLCSVCSARSGLLWILGLLCDGLLSSQLPHTYLASVIVSFSSVPILLLPVSHLESALKSPITILSFLFSICITPFCLFVLIHPTSCVPCSELEWATPNLKQICPRNTCLFCDLLLLV